MKSNHDSTSACLKLRQAGYPIFTLQTTSLPSPSLLAPSFPSFAALVEGEQLREQEKKKPSQELFDAILGDPRVLYYELMEDPSRFEEGTAELIQQIVSGQKPYETLSAAEKNQLNLATLDWARSRHQKRESPTSSGPPVQRSEAVKHLTRAEALADPSVELEYREDGQHMPVTSEAPSPDIPKAPTHWWRKG